MIKTLKLSEHSKERLLERYDMVALPLFVRAISNPSRYKLLNLNNTDEIRGIDWQGKEIQYVVNKNTVKTFIPPNYARNEEAIMLHELRLENIRKTKIIKELTESVIQRKESSKIQIVQLQNQKRTINELGKKMHDEGMRNKKYHFDRPLLNGIMHYIKYRKSYLENLEGEK